MFALNTVNHVVNAMGLTINEDKDDIGQEITFLGASLSTIAVNGSTCAVGLTKKRRVFVAEICLTMGHWKGPITVRKLMSFAGVLMLCAQFIFASKLYLRSVFSIIGSKDKRESVLLSPKFRSDCAWWRKAVTVPDLCGTVLQKRAISTTFASWDASFTWGIGGLFGGKYFSVPWSDYASDARPDSPLHQGNTPGTYTIWSFSLGLLS